MTLNQLVCKAASVYPDGYVLEYWDAARQKPRRNRHGGDTLAEFVAFELSETYDPDSFDGEQIASAVKAMQRASDELAAVAHALSDMAVEIAARRAA